jgi:hypothetical protein
MELPEDIIYIINQYSKPITRPDWRQGCNFKRALLKEDINYYSNFILYMMISAVRYGGHSISVYGVTEID